LEVIVDGLAPIANGRAVTNNPRACHHLILQLAKDRVLLFSSSSSILLLQTIVLFLVSIDFWQAIFLLQAIMPHYSFLKHLATNLSLDWTHV